MRAWKRIVAFLLALTILLVCTVAVANENDTPPMDVPGTEGEGNNDTPPIDVPGENDGLGPNDTPPMYVPDDDEEPEPPATSGTCGTNLTWAYADGVLTITGTGDMDSYDETNPAPWSPLAVDIETVALPDGLLSIGDEAFKDCAALTGITIPNSVTAIGEDAFAGCDALATVTYGGTEATRASIAIENGNGKLTGAAWTYTGGGSVIVIIDPILSGSCGESLT